MITFHYCKTFLKKINGQFDKNIKGKFSDLSERTRLVNSGLLHDYCNSLYSLKIRTPLSDIIIQKKVVLGKDIYFVRDLILSKDEGFYFGNFVLPLLKSGEWLEINQLEESDINDYIEQYEKEKLKDSLTDFSLEKLPKDKIKWLEDYKLMIKYEIFESQEWVKYSLNENDKEGMRDVDVKSFANLLTLLLKDENNLEVKLLKKENNLEVNTAILGNFGIIYSEYFIEDTKRYLLFNAAHIFHQEDHWEKSINQIKEVEIPNIKSIDDIARLSFRAYPEWTIKNDDLWFAIQKNNELSNLSLTEDQLIFFKNFSFPHYINGQAGSGKSTMLYYLFSNAYYYKCLDSLNGDIIFLTENQFLLEHTQKAVYDLLNNNPEFEGLSREQKFNVYNNFSSFKNFLKDLVPEEDKNLFPSNKYLNFSKFKELYENSYIKTSIKKKYSAEESWFTISTYIYGYDNSKKITAKEYESEVYLKSQKIPKEKFIGIEKNVLPFYEKLLNEESYWDKLKVIRYVEENKLKIPKYSIVFCDEAQDFCRVELRFILKLSEFLEYDLSNVDQIPVIFAGDANQTVNPTGFREREMTEMLYTELKEMCNFEYKKSESVYNPLYNYRSKQPVVTLANFIQYYRKKHFDIRLVKPQIPKRPETSDSTSSNIFFNYSELYSNQKLYVNLKEKIKYKIFIVPVDREECDQYIHNNTILSGVEKAEIKTAVEAKGAEYNQVVLYGFGDYYNQKYGEIENEPIGNDDENFQKAYFFNKLYVAITRAQTELIIIDSEQGKNNFWKKIVNDLDVIGDYWSVLNNFKDNAIIYDSQSIGSVIKSSLEDARASAQEDKRQGVYDGNPSRLRVASTQFFKIGEKKESLLCLALAEELKERWKEAAELYLKSEFNQNKLNEAAICFFKGQYFDELRLKIGSKLKSVEHDIRMIVSEVMTGNKLNEDGILKLSNNRGVLSLIISEVNWRDRFIDEFIGSVSLNGETEVKRNLADVFNVIAKEHDTKLWGQIAKLNFEIENYPKAIEAWDKLNERSSKEYVQSKIIVSRENNDKESELVWLYKSKGFAENLDQQISIEEKIIKLYEKNVVTGSFLYNLYASACFILRKPDSNIHILGKMLEESVYNNVKELDILIEVFENLIRSDRLNPIIYDYVISRLVKNIYKKESLLTDPFNLNNLNSLLNKLNLRNNKKYLNYTLEDIENISEFPEEISFNPPNHFVNIEINGFRQFAKLKIENIGKFNLVVGDNNIGKTSLLEALLFTHNKEKFFLDLAYAYIERKNLPSFIDDANDERINISKYFLDSYFNNSFKEKKIDYHIYDDTKSSWNYEIKELSLDFIQDSLSRYSGINQSDFYGFMQNSNVSLVELPILLKNITPLDIMKSPLVSFGSGYNQFLAQIYSDKIDKKRTVREGFVEKMKVFIPEIDRIIVDTENGDILIEENGNEEGVSLHQYGEGANKLFRILVQISINKNNKILIDEVDAGIHHSRFSKFWQTILHFAEIYNTQVFATTHNLECIKQFNEILNSNEFKNFQDSSRVITLLKLPLGNIKSYTRVFEEFDYSIENNIELRGKKL